MIAAVSLVLGVIGGVMIVVTALTPVVESGSAPVRTTPLERSMVLQRSDYVIFEYTGQTTDVGANLISVTPDDVVVTDPAGRPVRARGALGETLDRNTGEYSSVVAFTVTTPGTYRISVRTDPPAEVIVTRSPEAGLFELKPWVIVLVAGLLGIVVGLVLLGTAPYRRAGPPVDPVPVAVPVPVPVAAVPPPGWYPDRNTPGRSRYWDGRQWTDHTR